MPRERPYPAGVRQPGRLGYLLPGIWQVPGPLRTADSVRRTLPVTRRVLPLVAADIKVGLADLARVLSGVVSAAAWPRPRRGRA
jgi:hypothetical protein